MNCTGKRCIMQHDKVDPATCQCVSYCPQATPPKRNADRFRAKSDEELAEWIETIVDCALCQLKGKGCKGGRVESRASCRNHWLDWLRQEAT